jgi:hypothetical protein
LIVDDNDINRFVATEQLQQAAAAACAGAHVAPARARLFAGARQ